MASHSLNVGILEPSGLGQRLWPEASESCGNHGRRPARHLLRCDRHHLGRDGAQEHGGVRLHRILLWSKRLGERGCAVVHWTSFHHLCADRCSYP